MGESLIQAVSKRQLIKMQRRFLNGAIAKKYTPEVAESGYNTKTKMYYVKYKYDTSKIN